jgi:hypothetical protein
MSSMLTCAGSRRPASPAAPDAGSKEDPFAWMAAGNTQSARATAPGDDQAAHHAAAAEQQQRQQQQLSSLQAHPAAAPPVKSADAASWTRVSMRPKKASKPGPAAAGTAPRGQAFKCEVCRWSSASEAAAVLHFKVRPACVVHQALAPLAVWQPAKECIQNTLCAVVCRFGKKWCDVRPDAVCTCAGLPT